MIVGPEGGFSWQEIDQSVKNSDELDVLENAGFARS